jgi:uncharacterized protein
MNATVLEVDEVRAWYAQGDAAHDFDHVLRVMRMGERIAQAEGADRTVVRLAALLHDLPMRAADEGDARRGHHRAAAEQARALLTARGLAAGQVENVAHCVEAHRFRDRAEQPQTLEAKCLYDADKLDSIGAIGVGRAFAFGGAHGSRLWTEPWPDIAEDAPPHGADYTPVHEYVYKLRKVLATLHTPTARRIGEERHAFMVAFYAQLDAEMAGEG